jgi:hypothetical protein
MSKPFLKIDDFTGAFMNAVAALKQQETLVGIPEDENDRTEDGEIGNAALLFINNFGSPANNIPARPVMEIGIRNAQDAIALEMKRAAQEGLSKGGKAVTQYFDRVGMIASNSVKRAINEQIDIEPPAQGTLNQRERKGFKGTKSLIVTGQMRNAITYVVRAK